ncbi:hypothetical protein G7070_08510 [Propioniciclava coleopterorum]|uniref:Uncharacterized protein n=1 Tax=Propioniciclava coleopterorum TaxID=2714937 RepID=A0A6G7Y6Q0_9ACTN|nr:hypothetical protein [Propioniciclava coleopterorum]QIK72301.1 hypothetical protein G7070_08510 [Propioniciclava coleopterorum]
MTWLFGVGPAVLIVLGGVATYLWFSRLDPDVVVPDVSPREPADKGKRVWNAHVWPPGRRLPHLEGVGTLTLADGVLSFAPQGFGHAWSVPVADLRVGLASRNGVPDIWLTAERGAFARGATVLHGEVARGRLLFTERVDFKGLVERRDAAEFVGWLRAAGALFDPAARPPRRGRRTPPAG